MKATVLYLPRNLYAIVFRNEFGIEITIPARNYDHARAVVDAYNCNIS